mgnify:CR=1 FL=1
MKVRYPEMDFSNLRAHWAKVPEFAHSYNAFSTVPAHIEPFLIKVMVKAKKVLDSKHEQLHKDIEIFNKQEVQHCKQHVAFNKKLYELGYPEMADLEEPYKNDYERFLKEKSLRFNVAYCEGFEAMGSAAAQVYFEDLAEYLDGADEEAMNLWKWHLAEEFEHREVCADVYRTLFGSGLFAYFYRVWAFIYATKHIGAHTKKVAEYLNAKDRESMSPEELSASKQREKTLNKKVAKASLKRLMAVFSPFYDPGKKQMSPGMAEVLASYPDSRS